MAEVTYIRFLLRQKGSILDEESIEEKCTQLFTDGPQYKHDCDRCVYLGSIKILTERRCRNPFSHNKRNPFPYGENGVMKEGTSYVDINDLYFCRENLVTRESSEGTNSIACWCIKNNPNILKMECGLTLARGLTLASQAKAAYLREAKVFLLCRLSTESNIWLPKELFARIDLLLKQLILEEVIILQPGTQLPRLSSLGKPFFS